MSLKSLNQDMVFVGLEGAGKTSIISRVFKFFSPEEISKLTPTVLMDASLFSLKIIQQPISILDLGGQEQFLNHHLKSPNIFTDAKILIYVVDIQRLERLKMALQYFAQVKAIVRKSERPPREFLLLHKYDKSKRAELNFLLPTILTRLLDVLGNNTTFFMTSIYDDSLLKVFTYILSFLFPIEVISQGLSHELTSKLFPAIIAHTLSQRPSIVKKTARIYNYMYMFGKIIANSIVQRNWYYYFAEQLNLTQIEESSTPTRMKPDNLSKKLDNIKKIEKNYLHEPNSQIFLNLLDEKTMSFDIKTTFRKDSSQSSDKSAKSGIDDEFLMRHVLTVAFQGLINGFCESVGCTLELLALIPQINPSNDFFQLEGAVKCL